MFCCGYGCTAGNSVRGYAERLRKPRMTRISGSILSMASDTDALQAMLDSMRRVPATSVHPILLYPCYPGNRWLNSLRYSVKSCLDSRLLVLAEFLEARIIPKRIEHWIEPEQCRSERHARS